MKIEIITTPNGDLKETGFGTIKACKSVLKSLKKKAHKVELTTCNNESDLNNVVNRRPDLVVLAVKYIPFKHNKKIWLSEYFKMTGINYTGSSKKALRFDSNKVKAKELVKANGIRTADFFTATPNQYLESKDLQIPFPLFLKPIYAANSNGIDEDSLVNDFESFQKKVNNLFITYRQPVLVEKYLEGREFTVAIIETLKNWDLIVSSVEIVSPETHSGVRILGRRVKQEDSEELKKILESKVKNKVEQIAVSVFHLLGASDCGRIDLKMDEKGNLHFMEVNLVPGMTKGSSYFPKAFEIANGMDYDTVINLFIEKSLERNIGVKEF